MGERGPPPLSAAALRARGSWRAKPRARQERRYAPPPRPPADLTEDERNIFIAITQTIGKWTEWPVLNITVVAVLYSRWRVLDDGPLEELLGGALCDLGGGCDIKPRRGWDRIAKALKALEGEVQTE